MEKIYIYIYIHIKGRICFWEPEMERRGESYCLGAGEPGHACVMDDC